MTALERRLLKALKALVEAYHGGEGPIWTEARAAIASANDGLPFHFGPERKNT